MNRELEKILYRDFPNLYRGRKMSIMENLMPFGFECNDGWFQLIYDLSYHITKISPEAIATQVKEKLAGLRFYVDDDSDASDEVYDLTEDYERLSVKICERCGEPGKVYEDDHWYRTMCPSCRERFIVEYFRRVMKSR